MKEWTQGFPQSNALVQAQQFNDEYDTHKGTFNGGLDRTALNDDWCNRTHLKDNALLTAATTALTANTSFVSQPSGSSYSYFGCVQFSEYQGGWASTTISQSLSDCHEGFLHVELKGSLYINQYEAQDVSPNKLKIRLNLNGVPIVGAGYFVQPFISFRICGDVPVTKGTNEITVDWRMTGANGGYSDSDPIMHMFGVQLFTVVRWR